MTLSSDQVEDRLLDILDRDSDRQQAEIEALLAAAPDHRELIRLTLEANPAFHDLGLRLFTAITTPPAGAPRDDGDPNIPDDDPERVGPYVIRQWLGAGGMGTVYLAERTTPVHQRVALKVIKRGMDSAQILARFAAERQVLAAMDHPAIARVLDVGTADDGRPYFAMEYVDGEPITTFADRHRLSVHDRLELFLQVCYGVQHAHGKGVVHRDLKPGNVLVTERDGERQVKIIDFGVAKALFGPIGRTGMLTVPGQIVGTPEYMSPEQADGRDVDAGTDVYALGAILYELLVGARPFDRDQLLEAGWNKIAEVLRNTPAPRPSTRLNDRAFARVVVGRRNTEFRALLRELRSDLDWVVMRAIEPDRERRYLSPSELAADVLRYLQGEVVSAGRPSAWHRVRKLARRHRAACAAIVTGIASLALGLATTLVFLREARHYQDEVLSRDDQIALAATRQQEAEQALARALQADARALQAEAERAAAVARAELAATERAAAELRASSALAHTRANIDALAAARAEAEGMERELLLLRRAITETDEVAGSASRELAAATARAAVAEQALTAANERVAALGRAGATVWLAGWLDRQVGALRAGIERSADMAAVDIVAARGLRDGVAAARWLLARDGDTWIALHGADATEAPRLRGLLAGLAATVDTHGALADRVACVLDIHDASADAWTAARRRLAANARYDRLDLPVQFGLVPLGPGRDGYEVFWHVTSGARPERDDGGTFRPRVGDGALLVLVPGGLTEIGAQRPGPGRDRNLDPDARPEEGPPHQVPLAPYFVGVDLLTRAQWRRLGESNGATDDDSTAATSMSWLAAEAVLKRNGLELPTEAQWEGAARAGLFNPGVGVAQWCRDRFGVYGVDSVATGSGERRTSNPRSTGRVVRGASLALPPGSERPAARARLAEDQSAPWLGVRVARQVRR